MSNLDSSSSPDSSNLIVHLINARSICNKIDYLRPYIEYYKPDILAITETWGRAALTDSLITPHGFTLFRKDRLDRLGGGVLLLVRNDLNPIHFSVPLHLNSFYDSVWCVIKTSESKDILIGCVYRPPTANHETDQCFYTLLDHITDVGHDFRLVMGDFNAPNTDWTLLRAAKREQTFVEAVLANCLTQMVMSPTREDSILDLVFVNDVSLVSSVDVAQCFPGSDHNTVSVNIMIKTKTSMPTPKTENAFFFSKADWSRYRDLISSNTRDQVINAPNVDDAWSALKRIILLAADTAIPRVSHRKRIEGVPISGSVRRAFRNRKRIYQDLKGSKSPLASDLRDVADANLKHLINTSRKNFELSIAQRCKSNPKSFWSYARSSFANKPKVASVFDSSGAMTSNDKDTANAFNDFFASVFSAPETDLPQLVPSRSNPGPSLCTFSVTVDSIMRVLKSLPTYSSSGPDGISNMLLKEGGPALLILICDLFSMIITAGTLPSEWKSAVVVPIFKKGNRHDRKNYRPISLTCTLCKVFERLLKEVMLNFLSTNNLINDSQHGFLPKRSCCSALLAFLEQVTDSVNNNKVVDSVYLDFSKAFDSVPHKRLTHKLEIIGFSGDIIKLVESFLSDRKQRVSIANSCSDYSRVTSGVPQGSVLGPLLFVIYVNDIDTDISSSIIKFADDIKLFKAFDPSQETRLQNDLDKIAQWCETWQ